MTIIKRILSLIGLLLGAIGMVLCLAVIIGAWWVNPPITNGVMQVFTPIEAALAFGDAAVGEFNEFVADTQTQVTAVADAKPIVTALEDEIQQLLQQKEKFEFLLQAHQNTCSLTRPHIATTVAVSQPLHQHALNLTSAAKTNTMTPFEEAQLRSVSRSHTPQTIVSSVTSNRPSSLAIRSSAPTAAVTEALGIPISTPSAGALFGFDAMAEGHTGLTPLTGMPSTSIATPTTQSCSGEVQTVTRKSPESNSSNELSSPTTLIAL